MKMNGTDVVVGELGLPVNNKTKPVSKLLLGTRVAHEQHGWGEIIGYHSSPRDGHTYIVLFDKGMKHRKKERALVLDRASFKLLR